MANFSSGLRITGVDDFMRPETECVVVNNGLPKPIDKSKVKLKGNSVIEEQENGKIETLAATKITLSDCLACSGCLTTAESVLVEAQGVGEFLKHINTPQIVVVSLSAQSRASIGVHFGLTQEQVFGKLTAMFSQIGVQYVLDSNFAQDLSLLECAAEFVKQKRAAMNGEQQPLPMLLGTCPGWVCYCEKTHGDLIPHISTTKSPQQIMGSLIKTYLAKSLNKEPKDIYHMSIMSCYDKKLEASRPEFQEEHTQVQDVDCVLTTSEILQLLTDLKIDFLALPESQFNLIPKFMNVPDEGTLVNVSGGTSGGYLEYVFSRAAKELYNVDAVNINYKQGRNTDFSEISLEVGGKILLNFARSTGFRNIQNTVRRIKKKNFEYDFVEIMACPGGCTNGGGQIGAKVGVQTNKKTLVQVNELYNQPKTQQPDVNPNVQELYRQICKDDELRQKLLHTSYRAVPKMELKNPLSIKW